MHAEAMQAPFGRNAHPRRPLRHVRLGDVNDLPVAPHIVHLHPEITLVIAVVLPSQSCFLSLPTHLQVRRRRRRRRISSISPSTLIVSANTAP